MIKLAELLSEKHMTPAQKKKRGEIYDTLVSQGMESKKAGRIATSKAMAEATFTDKYDNNPKLKGKQTKLPDELQAKLVKEGDHEVSMAVSSLEAIAKAIVELRQKLGNVERNIPGWIQDHIAKAENYIEQAAQGFHELKEGAKVRTEPQGGGRIELVITSKDKAEVEKEIEKIEREYPSAGYGTFVKKKPFQKGDTWVAVVRRGTTSGN